MKKIMIVDDEPDQINTIEKLFKDEYEIIGAGNGEKCIELLNLGKIPDLILLDLMMPGMSGWDVHDKLKKKNSHYNHIPLIFLTGVTDNDQKEVGEWFGEDFIEKPFIKEDLKKRIEVALERKLK